MTPLSGLLPFKSLVSTLDGRLKRGATYIGRLVSTSRGIRVLVSYDEHGSRMTFNPSVLIYIGEVPSD